MRWVLLAGLVVAAFAGATTEALAKKRYCGDLDQGVGVKDLRTKNARCGEGRVVARRWQRLLGLRLR